MAEFPLYTRNYVQEGGGIQLGKPERPEEPGEAEVRSREVDRRGRYWYCAP